MLTLSDGSVWVLRKGVESAHYVHIHPGRYSKYSIRVKATTLKSAIAIKIFYGELSITSLGKINDARKFLNISPIKNLDPKKSIGKMLTIL